jgi:DNA primase
VLTLPGGVDPDEYVQQHGIESYRRLADSAPTYFHWLADMARSKFDLQTGEGRAQAFQFLWPSLQRVQDKLERAALAGEVSAYLGLDPQLIREQFRRAVPDSEAIKRVTAISSSIPSNEKLLLNCVLKNEEARAAVLHYFAESGIPSNLQLKDIFGAMLAMRAGNRSFSLAELVDRLQERDQKIVSELSFEDGGIDGNDATAQALGCLQALEARSVEQRCADLRRRIRQAEGEGKLEEALRLTDELERTKGGHGVRRQVS